MMDILNLLAKSSVHVIVFEQETKEPIQFGSGCIVHYKGRQFVLTVNHVTELKGFKTYAALETGQPIKNNESPFYSIGGLAYFDLFKTKNIDTGSTKQMKLELDQTLDIAFAEYKPDMQIKQKGFEYFEYEISPGDKVALSLDNSETPKTNDLFGFFGHIKHEVIEPVIRSEVTFKLDLTYQGEFNRFLLFNTPEIIKDESLFEGTSGAPILNQDGQLVGLVCSVNENTKSVFGFPIDYCKELLDIAIATKLV